jgi:tetratricopeptide (TPR) repeat protein/outer membrane protein OmpA-like peptidoglycan-associated protein
MSRYSLLLMLVLGSLTIGQGQSLKSWLAAADTSFAKKDYYSAYKYYEAALHYDTNSTDVRYKMAESARMFNAFKYAAEAYQQVLDSPEKASYPLASLWLGELMQKMGDYGGAQASFQQFLDTQPGAASEYRDMATKGIRDCNFVLGRKTASGRSIALPVNMGDQINSPYSDFGPFFMGDTLYYSSMRFTEPKDKTGRLYSKVLKIDPATAPVLLPPSYNQAATNTSYSSFNPEGKGVYYCNCDYVKPTFEIRCDLYFRSRSAAGWGEPLKLSVNRAGFTSIQPSVGRDAKGNLLLFFVSNRPGGKGKADIWAGPMELNGDVLSAEPVAELNTIGNDVSPFYHNRSRQLFFSTDGRVTNGGYDVYRVGTDGKAWADPVQMGPEVNSSFDDMYYVRNAKGDKAVFGSNRWGSTYIEEDKEACCFDLYEMPIDLGIKIDVFTFDASDSSQLNATRVRILEVGPDGKETEVFNSSNPNGNDYTFVAERYKKYKIVAEKDNFIEDVKIVDLSAAGDEVTSVTQNMYLMPIDLEVLTFEDDDKTRPMPPLNGTTVKLVEIRGPGDTVLIAERTNPNSNDFLFTYMKLNRPYVVYASKTGFIPAVVPITISTETVKQYGPHITLEIPLRRIPEPDLGPFFPIRLYFDNAIPDRSSYLTTTRAQYETLYNGYYPRKQEFIDKYTEGLDGSNKFVTARLFEVFFEQSLKGGYNKLDSLRTLVMNILKKGETAVVEMEGFASPRGNATYNKLLSGRRMVSVQNYFRIVDGGVFASYMDSGKLKFTMQAFGAERSVQGVPSNINDLKGSIYSTQASLERRVEIVNVKPVSKTN